MQTEEGEKLDATKLHGEVNQIVNQRLLITILAVTIFGVGAGWIVEKANATASDVGWITYGISLLLLLVLLALFCLHQALKVQLRVITAYLSATGQSQWEQRWEIYRKLRRRVAIRAYSGAQAMVFLLLGIAAGALPFLVQVAFDLKPNPREGFVSVIALGMVYTIVVLVLTFAEWPYGEKESKEQWAKILADERTGTTSGRKTSS